MKKLISIIVSLGLLQGSLFAGSIAATQNSAKLDSSDALALFANPTYGSNVELLSDEEAKATQGEAFFTTLLVAGAVGAASGLGYAAGQDLYHKIKSWF